LVGKESAAVIEAIIATHMELSKATGGTPLVPPSWTLDKYLITPHPLEDANMGTSAKNGVVDHKGARYRLSNLFVIDGGMIPERSASTPRAASPRSPSGPRADRGGGPLA